MTRRLRTVLLLVASLVATALVVPGLVVLVDGAVLRDAWRAASGDLVGLAAALGTFGLAFLLRGIAWTRVLPRLGLGQSLAAIHVGLGANHVLPLRLGEPLRIVSVVRRAGIPARAATTSTVALRSADIVALGALGAVTGPAVVARLLGGWGLAVMSGVAVVGVVAAVVIVRERDVDLRLPDATTMTLTAAAWPLEAVLVWQVARWFGVELGPTEAVVVLAAAVGAQLVALTPGGVGTYEAAATAALVAVGVDARTGLAVALGIHATKTLYSLVTGAVALVVPSPGLLGRWRLAPDLPPRPPSVTAPHGAPIVLFLPAHDEGPRVAAVVARAPAAVSGHPVEVVVVDDGSSDDTVAQAVAAGASVVAHPHNLGLGAAVRTGLAEGVRRGAAAVAFCDADGEYDPADLADLVGPVLAGEADYVLGSRFAGDIEHMRPHRRLGNVVLTRWVAWMLRRPVTDGQSGYRAFSPAAAAAARVPHDYNYAQVLTIDLVGQGFRYQEVPIRYRFRESGDSFVRLGRYLSRVVPTVWRQLNDQPRDTVAPAAGEPLVRTPVRVRS